MDFDSPWKVALEMYFRPFLRLLFPHIHDDIDWSRQPEMLDKEFQRVVPRALRGRQTVDQLVKVWRLGGEEAWVLVHVEVQAKRQGTFGERMHRYNNRIWDRYRRDVASLAVLVDDNPRWRPQRFERGIWGCDIGMTFPTVKLLAFAGEEAELLASDNPFAKIVLAHLKTLQTRDTPQERKDWKLRIARGLYECAFPETDVRQLLVLLDWLMQLQGDLEQAYEEDLKNYEEGRRMPYVTSFERNAMVRALEAQLDARFGAEGAALVPEIRQLNDADKYLALLRALVTTATLDEFRQACENVAAPRRPSRGKRSRRPPKP